MKKIKLLIILLIGGFLLSCANENESPVEGYKNKSEVEIYKAGKTALDKKHYEESIKAFIALDALFPFSRNSEQGQLDIIYAYYQNGDLDSAVVAADHYLHINPVSEHADYAYYMRGISNFEKNLTWVQKMYAKDSSNRDLSGFKQAFADFNTLVTQFPNSKYNVDARNRMVYIRNLVAEREVTIADFYYTHKAYVAAANRASDVVKHFQGTTAVKDALVVMVKSYRALGLTTEANDALRVLNLNFPSVKV